MATKSSAGWLILAFALAVPGVLFYQWYTHLDKAQKQKLSIKVRQRVPDGGPFASDIGGKNKLVNPIQAETPAQPAPGVSASSAAAPAAAAADPRTAPPSSADPPAAGVPAPAPVEAGAASGPKTNIYLAWRDPTLSPYDQVRLEKQMLDIELRKEEIRQKAEESKKPRAPKQPPVEKLIDLQGIVSTDSGNKAIVNGEMFGESDTVETKAGAVRIMKITSQGVVFKFKNQKPFVKSVNR